MINWKQIFLPLLHTDQPAKYIADRILANLLGYSPSVNRVADDVARLALALEAYVELRIYEIEGNRNEKCELCGELILSQETREFLP